MAEQILHFPRAQVGPGVIKRHRAMQTALRCLQPLARFVETAKEVDRVTEESRNLPGRYWSLLTCGEALHNNHHHIQNAARFSMRRTSRATT